MRGLLLIASLFLATLGTSQHTFSIVAVDTLTGEIGSAGATCGDSIIWPGTPGAYIISDVLPGIGAIHTQSFWNATNQAFARIQMQDGLSAPEIIEWLIENDVQGNPSIRQYGVVEYNGGNPTSAAWTGNECFDYKDHKTGPGYSIQGNILLGPEILDSMEARFLNTEGCLAERLMASMQGANVPGADSRCLDEGVSSLSAFLRVGKPENTITTLWLDLNVAGTDFGVEPIDELQTKYDNWKLNNDYDCPDPVSSTSDDAIAEEIKVFPNPSAGILTINLNNLQATHIDVFNLLGHQVKRISLLDSGSQTKLDLLEQSNGLYLLNVMNKSEKIAAKKVIINRI